MKNELISDALGSISERHILEAAGTGAQPRRHHVAARRIIAIAAAAVLCLALALPAFAASDAGYRVLYAASPAVAQYFKPVEVSCEDNDIRMEVVSAYFHGDTAEIYVSLQDLLGDRIDGTTDLYDSYRINAPFDSIGSCSLESYDPDTHTALFYINIRTMDGSDIPGGKVTFSVGAFMSHRAEEDNEYPQSLLTDADTPPETMTAVFDGTSDFGSLRGGSLSVTGEGSNVCLVPADVPLYVPMNHVTVTGVGYIDGALHIQTHLALIHTTDTNGYVYLVDADGQERLPDYSTSFWDKDGLGSYEDAVFLLAPEELEALGDCSLRGHFWSSAIYLSGDWEVTFPLEHED